MSGSEQITLNLTSILYLAFRLGPFILVCYFILSSLFSQDFKSIIYLAGLIMTCFVTILCSNLFERTDSPYICNQITLTGGPPMSVLPLSLTVYLFTFSYLLIAMFSNAKSITDSNYIAANNVPILILFPLIIVVDIVWLLMHDCATIPRLIGSFILGGLGGIAWAFTLSKSNLSSLLYMTVMSNAQVCQRPSKSRMKCKKVVPTSTLTT